MTNANENAIPVGLLKTCFESEHPPAIFLGRDTNSPILRFIGQMIFYTQDKEYIRKIATACLPVDYDGDSEREIDDMIDGALKKGFDQRTPPSKGPITGQCLDAIQQEGVELFHDDYQRPCITFSSGAKGQHTYYLTSRSAQLKLTEIIYKKLGRTVTAQTFKEVLSALQAVAIFDGEKKKVHLRIARHGNTVVLNLANEQGQVVVIDKDGARITTDSPVAFINSPNMAPIPAPQDDDGTAILEFQKLFNLRDDLFHRIIAFMINVMKPEGPYLMLMVEGEQGSGKSELSRTIKMLVDPSHAAKLRMPSNERDLMIIAKDAHLMVFDNISGLKRDMSDSFCSLLTGGGYGARKLYTDDELQIFFETRPLLINGITDIANRPDLLERSLSLRLPTMPEGQRKTEEELRRRLEELRPEILGFLCKALSCALRNFDNVETPTSVRMADAAKWLVAAEPALGVPEGTMLNVIISSQNDIVIESMYKNSLAIALINCIETNAFEGHVAELFTIIQEYREKTDWTFPKTASHLSNNLRQLRPALEKIGVIVEFGVRDRKGQTVRVWRREEGFGDEPDKIWSNDSEDAIEI